MNPAKHGLMSITTLLIDKSNPNSMKILIQYDYPASPGGLATQGELLYQGLLEIGIDARAVNSENAQEKEWYYQWFNPDAVVGIGY